MKHDPSQNILKQFNYRRLVWLMVLLGLLGLGVVFGLSSRFAHVQHPYDKIGHFAGFGFATLVLGFYFRNFTVALLLAIVAGFGLEVVQYFSSNRFFSYDDIIANCSGAVAAWILAIVVTGVFNWHKKRSV